MKSLAFSVPFCWPLIVRLTKKQTIRLLFIPNYGEDEQVRIIARDAGVKPRRDIECFIARITEVFPIKLADITLDIATRDGFTSIDECKAKLAEINNIKSGMEDIRWGFVIRWEPATQPTLETLRAVDEMYREVALDLRPPDPPSPVAVPENPEKPPRMKLF